MASESAAAESATENQPPDDRQLDAGEALQFLTSGDFEQSGHESR